MLTKFESKSARVKGLAFHPVRPWICASLHNGTIQLWDYRVGTVVDKFEEHEGPVRGVSFHLHSPLLVSGGDDYKIKVWDYKLRRCLFTLLGHLDYIRTVQFHNDAGLPWILSASDDQTIRLWNWQARTCMSVLTGHNHYVMCASFHPKEDLIVSASLDQTVRVWDTAGLRKKHINAAAVAATGMHGGMHGGGGGRAETTALNMQAELFGTNDVIVKYVLEGHDRGVNWASFHPTLPLLVSAADDRQIKLWRMSETKAWEVDTMRGHTNNVSCVMFHPKNELIVSNSEDRSIRVWDMSKRVGVQTFRRENDRFWILAAHREQNLLAAGHDTGMIVFKLERERPASAVSYTTNKLYYVRGRELLSHDFNSQKDTPIANLRRPGSHSQTDGIGNASRFLEYNEYNNSEGNVLVCSDVDGGCYELVCFGLSNNGGNNAASEGKRGSCIGPAVFIARNRFAILDKSRHIVIKNLQNETTKKVVPPVPTVDALFNGGASGRILLRAEDKLILFEQQSRRVLGDISAPKVKNVIWSSDASKLAILCKYGVIITDRNLEQLSSVSETVRVKSGAWDAANNIFVYTTLNHVKYCLANGDTGIIRTLDLPVYVTKVVKKQMFCLDREGKNKILAIDTTEAIFKLALANKRYGQVMEMVRHSRLCGSSIIAYLQAKDFPEVALHFVREPKTRFNLALACGNIEVAMETAFQLETSPGVGNSTCWHDLGVEALRQGNLKVVEMAYQRTKDFDRLSFLYVLTGNTDKLRKMLKISEMRGDVMGRYQNALVLGDAGERVKVLEASGNLNLAYLSAHNHGLIEEAERIREVMNANELPVPEVSAGAGENVKKAKLLQPPTPIVKADNWPVLDVQKAVLENLNDVGDGSENYDLDNDDFTSSSSNQQQQQRQGGNNNGESEDSTAWGDDDDLDLGVDDVDAGDSGGGGDGGWGDDDLDLGDDADVASSPSTSRSNSVTNQQGGSSGGGDSKSFYSLPKAGTECTSHWLTNSSNASDHASAGSFETAMQLLNRQISATNFEEVKEQFLMCYLGSIVHLPISVGGMTNSLLVHAQRNDTDGNPGAKSLPSKSFTLASGQVILRNAYRLFASGKFPESSTCFLNILHTIPLIVADSRGESSEIKELLEISREYITAIRLKSAMGECAADEEGKQREVELSAYFTHCTLQPSHLLLALRSAMGVSFKHKDYIASAGFARRLLELPEVGTEKNKELKVKATKVLQKSEQQARNEHNLNYDESKPFVVDCGSLVPIYRGEGGGGVKCSYCGSCYEGSMKGKLCITCRLSVVGVETIGLVTGA